MFQPIPSTAFDPNQAISSEFRVIAPPVRTGTVVPDTYFGEVARCIYVGVTGNISVRKIDGTDQVFTNVLAGTWLTIICIRVNSSGTTATGLVWGS